MATLGNTSQALDLHFCTADEARELARRCGCKKRTLKSRLAAEHYDLLPVRIIAFYCVLLRTIANYCVLLRVLC